MSLQPAITRSNAAIADIHDTYTAQGHRAVVVNSGPGAGKSRLVVHTATTIAEGGEPVVVIAQTNSQCDDLIDRMAAAAPTIALGRLCKDGYVAPVNFSSHPNTKVSQRIDDLRECRIIIGTAAKWVHITSGQWPWAIIDEAYQMRSDMLLRIAGRFGRMLFVGDPGQLDPFSTVEIDRWAGLPWNPMQSAVATLLRNNPHIPQKQLPLSWRLSPSATSLVAPAFYPFAGFDAATTPGMRKLHLPVRGIGGAVDDVLHTAATSGWALYELPSRNTIRTDAEAVHATASIAARVLQRGAETYCETHPGGTAVRADRIAVGAAHRDQVAAIRNELAAMGAGAIRVDTANRLQGAEYDVTVVLHPLSGRRDATAFHLETGRLCVLASRHRHACIVVARAGIPELLDAHPSVEPMYLDDLVKFPDGWEANQAVLAHLAGHSVRST